MKLRLRATLAWRDASLSAAKVFGSGAKVRPQTATLVTGCVQVSGFRCQKSEVRAQTTKGERVRSLSDLDILITVICFLPPGFFLLKPHMKLHKKIFATKTQRHEEKLLAYIIRVNLSALGSWWFNKYDQSFFSDQPGCVLAGGRARMKLHSKFVWERFIIAINIDRIPLIDVH